MVEGILEEKNLLKGDKCCPPEKLQKKCGADSPWYILYSLKVFPFTLDTLVRMG